MQLPSDHSAPLVMAPHHDFSRLRLSGAWPACQSPFEKAFRVNPVAASVMGKLHTLDILHLRAVSRTSRTSTDSHPRFLANLVLVRQGHERWDELRQRDDDPNQETKQRQKLPVVIYTVLKDALYQQRPQRRLEETVSEDMLLRLYTLVTCLDAKRFSTARVYWREKRDSMLSEILRIRELSTQENPMFQKITFDPGRCFFTGLKTRNLMEMLDYLPIGTNLTTLVLDGTAVDTEPLKFVLKHVSKTMRGLSCMGCPNIDCYMWWEWLCEEIYDHGLENPKPIPLEWLRVWGSGNVPEIFDYTKPVEQLPPPALDDGPPIPIQESGLYPRNLFVKCIPWDWHAVNTRALLVPRHLSGNDKTRYDLQLTRLFVLQKQLKLRGTYNEPSDFPLGEPHAIIALLALSQYMGIKLDVAFCANQERCYSFLAARTAVSVGRNIGVQGSFIMHNHTDGSMVNVPHGQAVRHQLLHTHALAGVGSRRASGGKTCSNCSLWEDVPSPPAFISNRTTTTVGGVTTGPGIGPGRRALGEVCSDCIAATTCQTCGSFFCGNCLFADGAEVNPLAMETCSPQLVSVDCSSGLHGPHCYECLSLHRDLFFECSMCARTVCLQCMPPEGIVATTELYGTWLPKANMGTLSDHAIASLEAFRSPGDEFEARKGELGPRVHLQRVFENCRGCNIGICGHCLGYGSDITDPQDLSQLEEEYIQCCRCDGRFCCGCAEIFLKCACGKAVCKVCWEDEIVLSGIRMLVGTEQWSACGDVECWASVSFKEIRMWDAFL